MIMKLKEGHSVLRSNRDRIMGPVKVFIQAAIELLLSADIKEPLTRLGTLSSRD